MVLNNLSLSEHIQRNSVARTNVLLLDDGADDNTTATGTSFSIDDSFAMFQVGSLKKPTATTTTPCTKAKREESPKESSLPTLEEIHCDSDHSGRTEFIEVEERDDHCMEPNLIGAASDQSRSLVSFSSSFSFQPEDMDEFGLDDDSLAELDISLHQEPTRWERSSTKAKSRTARMLGNTTFARNVDYIQRKVEHTARTIEKTTFAKNMTFLQHKAEKWTTKIFGCALP